MVKIMIKKVFFTLLLVPLLAGAKNVEINGIYYVLDNSTNEATVARSSRYSGYIKIPSSIEYENVNYKVTTISSFCFESSGLTSIDIPSTIKTIEGGAFAHTTRLSYVNISDIESWLKIKFGEQSNPLLQSHSLCLNGNEITELVVPNGITSLNDAVFEGWSALKSIYIPNSVTSIGAYAFRNCSGLTSIDMPNSITTIRFNAFFGCNGLLSCNLPNGITKIERETFGYCTSLASINIPLSVQSIDYNAFIKSGLESVVLPEGLKSVGDEAFAACRNLSFISIPKSIKDIGNNAFAGGNIKDVYCYSEEIPNTSEEAFGEYGIRTATLHVPTSAISMYKRISPWSYFGNIVEIGGGEGERYKCEKPTISYQNGKLSFRCATEGAICRSTISDTDITSYDANEIQLGVTYTITVYATKIGYDNSETATATLCWIDVEPKKQGIDNGIAQVRANAVMIKAEGGLLTIEGVDDNTNISVYSLDGVLAGSAISKNGVAFVNTNFKSNSIAIVKIGNKSVKVAIK